ncbi:MAG: 50S ribosomal protein L35 [Armatimonadota bacterium]|nr:50S ribosomal protein L35 [Armatimonadota bacterium]
MPKAKTHQGTRKRIRITGTGKLLRGRQGGGHLKQKKSPRRRRDLGRQVPVSPVDTDRVRHLLPYD